MDNLIGKVLGGRYEVVDGQQRENEIKMITYRKVLDKRG